MATKTKDRPKTHPDQLHIPGAEPERNARIHAAARAYRKVRDARIAASAAEKVGKTKLIDTMKEEDVAVYVDPNGYTVTVDTKQNVHLSDAEKNGEPPAEEE